MRSSGDDQGVLASIASNDVGKFVTNEKRLAFVANRKSFERVVSRAGLEPATHWLKASCSTD